MDLPEKYKAAFKEQFYILWDVAGLGKHDIDAEYPHGMPWLMSEKFNCTLQEGGWEQEVMEVAGWCDASDFFKAWRLEITAHFFEDWRRETKDQLDDKDQIKRQGLEIAALRKKIHQLIDHIRTES